MALPWDAPLARYEESAASLLAAFREGVPEFVDVVHRLLPAFREPAVPWKVRDVPRAVVAATPFGIDEARLAVARFRSYEDWSALAEHVTAIEDTGSAVFRFEAAVQATIDGRVEELQQLLDRDPGLSRARSSRRTCHDPSVHEATLLHYVAANGVESVNQRTPANAVAVARLLLERGADPDATARLYGGRCSVMSMLVSSAHPDVAGVHVALVDLLVAHGASVEASGEGAWTSPLATALVFGYLAVARALARHGARVDRLDLAAGLGELPLVQRLLPSAEGLMRHRALALASQLGHAAVVAALLDVGEDPDRFNPEGMHSHSTPLHQAAVAGHREVVELLVRRGARADIADTLWHGTPADWAVHGGHQDIATWLRERRASTRRTP